MICALRRAQTLQDGNAAHLLQHEHPGDTRHRDAAENDDHQADETQVVLRPIEVSPDLIVGRAERAGVDEFFLEVAFERRDERLDPCLGQLDQQHVPAAAAEREQAGGRQVGEIDQHARTEAEVADAPARLVLDDAANREGHLADQDLVADLHVEGGQQFRPHQHAAVLQHRVRVGLAALELERAVQRKDRLHGAQFDHAGHRRPASAGRTMVGVSIVSVCCRRSGLLKAPIDGLARFRRPVAVGRDQHVGGDQRPRLLPNTPRTL